MSFFQLSTGPGQGLVPHPAGDRLKDVVSLASISLLQTGVATSPQVCSHVLRHGAFPRDMEACTSGVRWSALFSCWSRVGLGTLLSIALLQDV